MPARRACPSAYLRATLRPARLRARTTPDALRARPPCVRYARHNGTRPRRAPPTPATLQPPRAGGVAPRHARSGAPRACSGRGMRFRPPPSAQGYVRGARRLRPEAPHRDPRDHQLVGGPRRGREGRGVELSERTLGLVEAPDQEEAPDLEIPRMRGVHPVAAGRPPGGGGGGRRRGGPPVSGRGGDPPAGAPRPGAVMGGSTGTPPH